MAKSSKTTKTNWKKLIRQIHYWVSLAIFIPCGIMIMAGLVLMVKKDFAWIQPPTLRSQTLHAATNTQINLDNILNRANQAMPDDFKAWSDIDKIDIRPTKGIAKLISKSGYEAQIDLGTYQVLSLKKRRSDWIENLHDGSFFAPWVKRYIFLPTGILLLFMWMSGAYLFLLPFLAKAKKEKRKRNKNAPPDY